MQNFILKYQGLIAVPMVLVAIACTRTVPPPTAELKLQFTGSTNGVTRPKQNHHPRSRTVPATAADMDCLLLNVKGNNVGGTQSNQTFNGGVTPACLGIGVTSPAASVNAAVTTGISVKVKPGLNRTVEVLGYMGSLGPGCAGKTLSELLTASRTGEALYLVGSTDLNLSGDTVVTVSNSYVAGSTSDRVAPCVVGGGSAGAANLFSWDGADYNDLGLDADSVDALYWDSSSNVLYVGGDFQDAGGNTDADYAAIYDPSTTPHWSAMGPGLNGRVRAITKGGGSNVYVGGDFTDFGGNLTSDGILRWAGGSFQDLTSVNGSVYALSYGGSNLYVGGTFTDVGGNNLQEKVVRFDEPLGTWHQMGSSAPGAGNDVYALTWDMGNSLLMIGGSFANFAGVASADNILKFISLAFAATSVGLPGPVYALSYAASSIFAAGNFTNGYADPNMDFIASYLSGVFSPLQSGMNGIGYAIASYASQTYVGGAFTSVSGVANTNHIAQYSGSWNAMGNGLNGDVTALATSGSNLYIGGDFDAEN